MVSFIEDEQRPRTERPQQIPQGTGVSLVDQQSVRHEEPRMGTPRVHTEPPFLPDLFHVVLVEDLKCQPEARGKLLLPLQQHRRRAGYEDLPGFLPQQQLTGNQTGFDGFSQAHIVCDEQIHPWHQQRFAERFELVGIQTDTCAKGRLE